MDCSAHNSPIPSALVVDDGPVERLTGKAMLESSAFPFLLRAAAKKLYIGWCSGPQTSSFATAPCPA